MNTNARRLTARLGASTGCDHAKLASAVRFTIPDSLLAALRARRDDHQLQRGEVRPAPQHAAATSLTASIKKLFSQSKSDVGQVAARYVDGMNKLQDEVEAEQDAFLLDPGMGPMTYLTA